MAEKTDKPRGGCAGCAFEYQLSLARSGEYKGRLVIRKHNSRTGPGLCEGAAKPPRPATGNAEAAFADPASVNDIAPYVTAQFDSMGSCGHDIMSGEEIRADGDGGWLCGLCSDEGPKPDRPQHTFDNGRGGIYVHEGLLQSCVLEECAETRAASLMTIAAQLPHDRGPETVTHIPHGHDFTDSSGTTWRHGGAFDDCTTPDCVQFRNRVNPPAVTTPVTHQCESGLFTELRNCPVHGVRTEVTEVAGHLNGVPVGYTHYVHGVGMHQGRKEACTLSPCSTEAGLVFADPHEREATSAIAAVQAQDMAVFADPVATPAELPPVSGQPEPERDRWGRYKILGVSHTRATSFAKLGSSTFALGEWNERMLIRGLTLRQDLLAMAHGLDVKRDKDTLNQIADQAQETAGNKVAANIGTAYHSFTERLDAGLITLDQVPEQWRERCAQYVDALAAHGLTTCPEWIERTTAVRADQVSAPVPVAGTLDRIFELPNGELVIGDLKTSSNIDYSWSEIAVQLALYAHGVNTFGLFDWNTKTWQHHGGLKSVRTDYAIVVHLPAQGDGCTLYRVDIERGWKFAHVSGMVQSRQKAKDIAGVMVPLPQPEPVPPVLPPRPEYVNALGVVRATTDPASLGTLYDYAVQSGQFTEDELTGIKAACAERWGELNIPY